ncbi:ATP-grasp domain-containing protein [Gracilimonas halophila]|uniref:RimK family alpha-L-glutamate ligase n=1 Tax=Gracilimonas halophila TaxID=1834464 RepID=A0ABW5JGC1_9BACT
MAIFDVTLLTDSRYVDPKLPGQYVQNILKEDQIVREALEKKGLTVNRKNWADPEFDWGQTNMILFRTNWDYFDRYDEFRIWVTHASSKTKFVNSIDLLNWNVDKHYLSNLSEKKIRIVPTRYIPKGLSLSLEELYNFTGWSHSVVKPTIGGAGRHTYDITRENISIISNKLDELMKSEDFMLQPFQNSVPVDGELSLIFFGEEYSHAVLKKAKEGDFRVQDDYGGTVHKYVATEEEVEFAYEVIKACPEKPAYARVDMIEDNDGELAVSELELIEPELWFRFRPEAADLLAEEVIGRL